MDIKNKEIFEKALKTLNDNDRKTLEAFAHFLLVSGLSTVTDSTTTSNKASNLLDKANEVLLKDYVKESSLSVDWFKDKDGKYDLNFVSFWLLGREKPLTFPSDWFVKGGNLTNNLKSLYVKFRPGTNRIDKIALDESFLTSTGKANGKKRILALSLNTAQTAVAMAPVPAFTTTQSATSAFVQKIVNAASDGWVNTPATAQISVAKSNAIFSKLDSFKEGRLRLSRVGEILFNELDRLNNKKYTWDSEFFFGSPHDFTDVKTGKTYDIKCHFHSGERLQLSQQTLNKCDADFIVSVMVEEDSSSYTATVVGYITKADFTAKTKPWAYNEYVELRSLELHELNSPKDLF